MAAGRALIDISRQGAHLGDAFGDLLAQQHPAAAGLGTLAQHDLDRVGLAQVVGIHAIARGQKLVDQRLRLPALLRGHAAVARSRAATHLAGTAAQSLLGLRRQRAETHPGDGDRDIEVDGLLGIAHTQHHIRVAALAIALERVARHAGTEKDQVVEMRHAALGAPAADIVDPGAGGALDLVDHIAVEGGRFSQALRVVVLIHRQYLEALSTLKLYSCRAEP